MSKEFGLKGADTGDLSRGAKLALGLIKQQNLFSQVNRYETPAERSRYRAIRELRTAQRNRAKLTGERRLSIAGRPARSGCNVAVSVAKTVSRILSGTSDASICFDDLCSLLEHLEFDKRVRGSHHLFRKAGVDERINLQRYGGNAKTCQVKQVRALILK